jgi:hypothetical protein
MSTIPLSVLELLKCELEPSALRRNFPVEPKNNHSSPSYIFVRQTANLPTRPAIGVRQAAALVREGAFGNCAADWGDVVVISDQAHYALLQLFTEVHDAWGRYRRRLSDIEKGSIMPSEAAKQSWVNFISR